MASTYTTGFGIEKIGSSEQDGTWGTTTNHNFDILDRIASYKAVAITTNADTATLTVREASPGSGTENLQDGMYRVIKFTGTLDSTCTITIAPNTAPAWFIIENATSGSQSIILSQGSGANVTVQNGKNAIIYCDGAGSGAAVVDALADLQIGTLEVTGAAAIDGALTGSSTIQGTTITATTAFVPDASDGAALGTTSLEFSDLYLADGAVIGFGDEQDVTLTHVADTGLLLSSTDQLQFGDSGTYIHQSADGVLDLVSDTEIEINATTVDINGAVDVSGTLAAGITTLSTSTTSHLLNLVSTEAGAGTGPVLEFYRNSSSPADNDSLGWLEFYGEEETSSDKVRYAQFGAKIFDSADGSFDGSFLWQMALAGSLTEFMKLSPTGFTFNEAGNAELDFRVESQYSNQALFLDAGAGTFAANVTSATFSGTISVPTDKKIFLDGGGDTYIIESAANVVSHFAGTRENLKVGYTGVSVNEGGNDVDFRVESSGNANMLFVDGGNNKVGIGTNTSDGTLHVYTASAGSVAASADADELVLENSGNAGLSILAAASSNAQIYFGEGTDNDAAFIQYNGSVDDLFLSTTNSGSQIIFKTDTGTAALTLDNSQNATFAGDVKLGTDKEIQFRDSALKIYSSADGQLDLAADTEIELTATTVAVEGVFNVSSTSWLYDDVRIRHDGGVLYFGDDSEVSLTHTADVGLTLNKELAVGGGSNLNVSNHFTVDVAASERYVRLTLDNNSTGGRQFSVHSVGDGDGTVPNSFAIYDGTASAWRQRIDSSGDAYFYGAVTLSKDTSAGSSPINLQLRATENSASWSTSADYAQLQFYSADASSPAEASVRASWGARMTSSTGGSSYLIGRVGGADVLTLANTGDATLTGDMELAHDGAVLKFGAGNDVTVTHVHDVGLNFASTRDNADSIFRFSNSSNTSGSDVRVIIQNGGTSGGDPLINLDGQATNATWSVGVDTSATKFVIADADKGGFDGSDEVFTIATGGNATFANDVTVNGGNIEIIESDAGATGGPALSLWRNSASPAASDFIGEIYFHGEDAAGNKQEYASIKARAVDVTSGGEDGRLELYNSLGGSMKSVFLSNNTATPEVVINEDSEDINFRVEGATNVNALVVDAGTDTVGIGTTADSTYALKITKPSANTYVQVYGQTGYAAEVHVQSQNASGALVAAMDNAGTGYLKTTINTPILFAIENTTKMRLDADGLKFGSDTAAANALDDYEEGTWTPTLTGATTTGSSQAYSTQEGRYTKIGRLVFVAIHLDLSSVGDAGGTARISLPMAVANTTGTHFGLTAVDSNAWDLGSGKSWFTGLCEENTSHVLVLAQGDDVGGGALAVADFGGTLMVKLSGCYEAA